MILLPYRDWNKNADVFLQHHLSSQIEVGFMFLKSLLNVEYSFPFTLPSSARLWKHSELYLLNYTTMLCARYVKNARNFSIEDAEIRRSYFNEAITSLSSIVANNSDHAPLWLGYPPLHYYHRSLLVRSDNIHYGRKWPDVPADVPEFNPADYKFTATIHPPRGGVGSERCYVRVRARSASKDVVPLSKDRNGDRCTGILPEPRIDEKVSVRDETIDKYGRWLVDAFKIARL